jgi:hypothetical protein
MVKRMCVALPRKGVDVWRVRGWEFDGRESVVTEPAPIKILRTGWNSCCVEESSRPAGELNSAGRKG